MVKNLFRKLNFIFASGILTLSLLGFWGESVLAATEGTSETEEKASASEETTDPEVRIGGGYAASGQIKNVGYTAKIYDATNGLPTSDANFILGARNGYIWIGGYSGIICYDGTTFYRLSTDEGLTSGRGLFEDSQGRIWVGTNDSLPLQSGSSRKIMKEMSISARPPGSAMRTGILRFTASRRAGWKESGF